MVRWLELGEAAATKDDHWEMISVIEGDQPSRQVARLWAEATPEGRVLAAFERPRAAGEGDAFERGTRHAPLGYDFGTMT